MFSTYQLVCPCHAYAFVGMFTKLVKNDIFETNGSILAQMVHSAGHETVNIVNQEVKGQGHTTPKIDLEALRGYHSRPPWVD